MQTYISPLQAENKPSSPHPSKLMGILVAIVVIFAIVILLVVLAQKNGVGITENPNLITADEKAQILESLQNGPIKTPAITEGEKANVLKSLQGESASTKTSSEDEKAQIIESLTR